MVNQGFRARLMMSVCALAFPATAQAADTTVTNGTTRTTVVTTGGSDTVTIEQGGSIVVNGARGITFNTAPTGNGPTINNSGLVEAVTGSSTTPRALDTQNVFAGRSITINNFATGIFRSPQDAIRIRNDDTDVTAATLININNAGLITSTVGQGIDLAQVPSSVVSIINSGTITGAAGIFAGSATIDNSGSIIGTGGGTDTNGEAIRLNGANGSTIILRSGSITRGTASADPALPGGEAIRLSGSGGNNNITIEVGATVVGNVRGTANVAATDTLTLTGAGTAILPTLVNIDRINFLSGDWTLAATTEAAALGVSIANGAVVRYGDGGTLGHLEGAIENNGRIVYNRTNTHDQRSNAAISGTGILEIAGTGRFAMTVANSYFGDTLINNGRIRGDAANVLSPNSAFVIGAAGTLELNGFDQTVASIEGAGAITTNNADDTAGGILTTGGNDRSTEFSGVMSGLGGLVKTGSGDLTLSGANSYTGDTAVAGGGLIVNGTLAGAVTVQDSTRLAGNGTIGGTVTLADGARLAPGDGGVGTLTVGGLTLGANSILDFELGDPGDLLASDRIQVNGDLTLDGTVNATDVGGFGFGVYRLIDYTGSLTDNGLLVGTVPAGTNAALVSVQTNVAGQVNFVYGDSGTGVPTVQFWDGVQTAPDGAIAGGSGSWTNGASNWTRANGTANDPWGSNFAVFQSAAGTVTVDDAISFTGMQFLTDGYRIDGGTGALTISGGTANIRVDPGLTAEIAAPIGGAGGLAKLDSGTLILSGANGYAGGTTVAGGTLVLRGSVAGNVAVSSGATLTGGGSAGGTMSIANGATLAPGEGGIGSLTVGGLTLSSGSILAFDFGAPGTSDHIQINGNLTLDGTLNATDVGGFGIGVYRLMDYSGSLTDNGLSLGSIPGGFAASQLEVQTSTSGQVNLIVDAVIPEIQFWDGSNITGNGVVDGGSGSWTTSGRNWADGAGNNNNRWGGKFAIFQGAAGTVTVDGAIATTGMQFMTDGYRIAPGAGTLALDAGGANIRVDPGVTATISAAVGGTGGLTKLDTGTLILSGANSYGGATTISGGTLRVLGGSAIPVTSAVSVAGGATLDVAASQTVGSLAGAGSVQLSGGTLTAGGTGASTTFSGAISGSGDLTKAGGGTLTLTGANTYMGATTVAGGTLAIGSGGSIAASSGIDLTTSGATLDISGGGNQATAGLSGVTGTRVLLGSNTLSVNGSGSATFGGVISGNGGLTKSGGGTLTLGGANTYAGATAVNAGTLVVNGTLTSSVTVGAAGRLLGTGRVGGLTIGGTLAPGNSIGTLTVNGNATFLAGSTFEVETMANGTADLVTATGSVTIDGGTVAVKQLDTSYGARTEYRIITAATRTGFFDGITSDLAFLTPTLSYLADGVSLALTRNDVDFTAVAQTANQLAVAGALSGQQGGRIYDTLLGFNADTARGAFDDLSGEIHADVAGFAVRDAQLLRDAVLDRTAAAGEGAGIWGRYAAPHARAGGDDGIARAGSGTSAFLLGVDADVGAFRVGVAGGYTHSDLRVKARQSEGEINSIHVGAYASGAVGGLRLRAGLSWADHKIETHRTVSFGAFGDSLDADGDGSTWQGFGEIGYRLGDDRVWVEPFGGLSAQRVKLDGLTERGGDAALDVANVRGTAFDGTLGARASADVPLYGDMRVRLDAMAGVRHAFETAPELRQMAFAGATPAFGVSGASFDGTSGVARIGASFAVFGGEIGLAYEGEWSGSHRRYGIQAGASWRF